MQAFAPAMRSLMLSGKTDSIMDRAQGTVGWAWTTRRPVHAIPKSHGPWLASRWARLTDKSSDRVTRRRRVTVAPEV
jgi:hypothetical protein